MASSFSWSLGGGCGTTQRISEVFPSTNQQKHLKRCMVVYFLSKQLGIHLTTQPLSGAGSCCIGWPGRPGKYLEWPILPSPNTVFLLACWLCDGSVDRLCFLSLGWALGFPEPRELSPMPPLLLFEAYDTDIDVFGKARALKHTYGARLRGV